MRRVGLLSLVFFIAVLSGCEGPSCDREPALTYDNWGEGFIATFCVGCHSALIEGEPRKGATVGVDFNTYGDVLNHAQRMAARSTGAEPDMPPSGGPSAEDVALLDEWLTCTVIPDAMTLEAE